MATRKLSPFPVRPDNEEQKRVLVNALRTAQSFALYFVVSEPFQVRPRLMREIADLLPEKNIQSIRVPRGTGNLLHLLNAQIRSPIPDLIFFYGLEDNVSATTSPKTQPFLLNLNATRNNFYQVSPFPIVFWISQFVMTAILDAAPDFVSVRSGVYSFSDEMAVPNVLPETVPPPRRVFLSYSVADRSFVDRLTRDLSNYSVQVLTDENEMAFGDSIVVRIMQQLQEADIIVLCLSENFFRSAWSKVEWETSLNLTKNNNSVRVIPLRLDDSPLPPTLASLIFVDFRHDYEFGLHTLLNIVTPQRYTFSSSLLTQVDRYALIAVLEDMTASDLSRVISHIKGASRWDLPQSTTGERVVSLVGYVESSVGPGLSALADVVVDLFPNLKDKIRPDSTRSSDINRR